MKKSAKTLISVSATTLTIPNSDLIETWNWHIKFPLYETYAKQSIIKYGKDITEIIPDDIIEFCPNYFKLSADERLTFWSNFLSALSYAESKHDTNLEYRENFTDSSGSKVISTGLFQLSYESSKAYNCNVSSHNDLKNPQINIECATKILNKWISIDHCITGRKFMLFGKWKGGARYWSVLRKKKTKNNIINNLKTIKLFR